MISEQAKAYYDGAKMKIGHHEWSIRFLRLEGQGESPAYRIWCDFIGPDSQLDNVEVSVKTPETHPPNRVIRFIQDAIERGDLSSNGALVIMDPG